ncbi:MAG: type VI secretion system ATPase TssH, partial [Candidatus Omnitrophica bacterium]|nr:type VI secretion system ATPase TssH [Candidatus Omnitrophota bacterium]
KDEASRERLSKIEAELKILKEENVSLRVRWQKEKALISRIRRIKSDMEELRAAGDRAEREGDLARASEIRYGKLVSLNKEMEEQNRALVAAQGGHPLLKEEVGEDDIAQVVAKWTRIPVERLRSGEQEKLVNIEELLKRRVIGQDEAVGLVGSCVRRSRAGLADPNRP